MVLSEFGITTDLMPLAGGTTGSCYRAGDLVLKRDQYEEVIQWLASVAEAVTPNPGFRMAQPIRSRSRRWTVGGWAASSFLEGSNEHGKWAEKLGAAARTLHRAIEHLPPPHCLDRRTDPLYLGDRAAWGEIEVSIPTELHAQVEGLSSVLEPVAVRRQVVHSDLCGNILLHDSIRLG